MSGFVKLHRKIQQHWIWTDKPFAKGQAWLDLVMMANYNGNKFVLGNEIIELDRGQLITSELKLMKRWGWSKTKIRNFLEMLEKDKMICKKTDHKKTTLTICNYSVWQDIETTERPREDREKTARRPREDTNKNIKNYKKVKKENNIYKFSPPSIEDVKAYCKERNNKVDAEQWMAFYQSKGWMVGSNKMKDWKAAVITWEKNNKPKPKDKQFEERHYKETDIEDLYWKGE